MADARLRALERSWLASGCPRVEAALLRALLHVGDLALERLEVAADAGYVAARLALGRPELAPDPIESLAAIEAHGRESAGRAALAMLRVAMPLIPELRDWSHAAFMALEQWARRPSVESERACQRAANRAIRAVEVPWTRADALNSACVVAGEIVGGPCFLARPDSTPRLASMYELLCGPRALPDQRVALMKAIRVTVSAWALDLDGVQDPTDRKLRELRGAWRRKRSVSSEAAYLRARVEAGDLSDERLAVAAHCGHPAARRALGLAAATPTPLGEWVGGLARFRPEVSVRAALAAGRLLRGQGDRAAVHATEAWLDEPTRDRAGEVGRAVRAAARRRGRNTRARNRPVDRHALDAMVHGPVLRLMRVRRSQLVGFLEATEDSPAPEQEAPRVEPMSPPAVETDEGWTAKQAARFIGSVVARSPESLVHSMIRRELCAWALAPIGRARVRACELLLSSQSPVGMRGRA